MIIIGNTLVSEDLLTRKFCCRLSLCYGKCCVEGDAGAPLEEAEIPILEKELDAIKPYMSPEGLRSLGIGAGHTIDSFGHPVTTLIQGKECSFTVFENGIASCAIERAFIDGATSFRKPISCHLYPVRISSFDEYDAVNVHDWSICATARAAGSTEGVYLYVFLKDPLIRRYGTDWYEELVVTAEAWNKAHP